MDVDKINKWLTLIANLGVLLGVFLVAYELQQNRIAIQAQTRSDISAQTVESLVQTMANMPLLEAQQKVLKGQDLTPVEARLLTLWEIARFRRWENAYYQYRQGLYSELAFEGQLVAWARLVDNPKSREWWHGNSNTFSPEFADLINDLLDN